MERKEMKGLETVQPLINLTDYLMPQDGAHLGTDFLESSGSSVVSGCLSQVEICRCHLKELFMIIINLIINLNYFSSTRGV